MASRSYGNVSSQLEQQPPIVNDNICDSYASFISSSLSSRQPSSQYEIGGPPGNKIRCDWPQCLQTFTRPSDLTRHRNTVHHVTKHFWCIAHGCNRSESYPGLRYPFPRKDKRDDHVNRVHMTPECDPAHAIGSPAYTTGGPAFTTDGPAFTNGGPAFTNGGPVYTNSGPVYHPGGPAFTTGSPAFTNSGPVYTNSGPVHHPGGPAFTTGDLVYTTGGPTDSALFLDASELFSMADAAYIVGCAGSTNGSGLAGFPNGEGSNWLPWSAESSETAGLADFDGLSRADGFTSVNRFTAVDSTDVSSCTTVSTLTTSDGFDCFSSGSMFNEFGSVDTATGLNDFLESFDSAI